MKLVMLDSGAYSAWTKGLEINLNSYIQLCKEHPEISYYVSLDFIPGEPGGSHKLTPQIIAEACSKSWNAYQRMVEHLPFEKVIPTFHRGDDVSWLKKYLQLGCPYIAIGGLADKSPKQDKLDWLRQVRPYFYESGRVRCKVHGFGFSDLQMLKCFPWHSVDCASWAYKGSMGVVWVPRKTYGKWDYTRTPYLIACTPRHPDRKRHNAHIDSLSPLIRKDLIAFLEESGQPVGSSEILRVKGVRKLEPGELWIDKGKSIQKCIVPGVTNKREIRQNVAIYYLKQAEKHLPIKHLYFAGNPVNKEIEEQLHKRLLSFAFLQAKAGLKIFKLHCKQVRKAKRIAECQS